MCLSDDDRQMLQNLKELLKEKKELRSEICNQLEIFRKAKNNSGLDISQALEQKDLVSAEKERLEKINASIGELEERIANIER